MDRWEAIRQQLRVRDQMHVLHWWDELDAARRTQLLEELESIRWDVLDPVLKSASTQSGSPVATENIAPADVYPTAPSPKHEALYARARQRGVEMLRAGRVAAFTVAGGQGTRLGFDGPKGAMAVTPIGDCSLFELFAKTILAVARRYQRPIAWYIMTSRGNHEQTVSFLADHDYFGLAESDVVVFPQGMLPSFDLSGRLLLAGKGSLALAPDGHGGSLTAMAGSGALDDMRQRGVDTISYFQVDNPLVKPLDPLFLGLHDILDSEMSTKVTRKADDLEKVGNVCRRDGKLAVVEYTEFPNKLAHAKNASGTRMFDAGNIAIHLLDVEFVQRIAAGGSQLPLRGAIKKIPFVNETGDVIAPAAPNALKLESFVFDALPLARNPLVLEVDRAEEFAPVKNATGVDSLETAHAAQVERACRWLEQAGLHVPRADDGSPALTVAIAPRFALSADDVRTRAHLVPPLEQGMKLLIDLPPGTG